MGYCDYSFKQHFLHMSYVAGTPLGTPNSEKTASPFPGLHRDANLRVFNWELLWDSTAHALPAASKDKREDQAQRSAGTRPRLKFWGTQN